MREAVYLILLLLLWLPFAALNAWVLTILWSWYIVPLFDAPSLSFSGALGVALIAGFLQHYKSDFKENPDDIFINAVILSIVRPLFALFAAWVYISIWPIEVVS